METQVLKLMDGDVKATGLKTLQGLIWESGFRSGELQSHVYEDVLPAIEAWRARGLDVRIYSSGSVAAAPVLRPCGWSWRLFGTVQWILRHDDRQ